MKGNEEDTRSVADVCREPAAGVSRCHAKLCIPSEPERRIFAAGFILISR